jgi:prevent-host-death family protein
MEHEPRERSARETREHFADVINDAIQGHITYVTSHGRRVAAVVPLTEIARKPECDHLAVTP